MVRNEVFPSNEMIVRLIEEQLWCGYKEIDSSVNFALDDENVTYLREKVFPTLVPALYELLRCEQRRLAEPAAFSGRYGATGNTHCVSWLAQYLLRNNALHSDNLQKHSYVLVNNLCAASEALEKLLVSSTTYKAPSLSTRNKGKSCALLESQNKRFIDITHRINDNEEKVPASTPDKKNEKQEYIEEMLVLPSKMRNTKQKTCHRPSVGFIPSPCQISCKIVEASGCGALAVLLGGARTGKCHDEKVWATNLFQSPTPYVVLGSFIKKILRKKVVSYVISPTKTQGRRVERFRDITLSVLFDTPVEDIWEREKIIERMVISCSNHSRTGYISIVCLKEPKGPLLRTVIPGTLVGPFMKVTFFPKNTTQLKVLRVAILELAFAESWTERCIVEEAVLLSDDEKPCLVDTAKDVLNLVNKKDSENAILSTERIRDRLQASFLVNSTASVSPVRMTQEDNESVSDSNGMCNQLCKSEAGAAVATEVETAVSTKNKIMDICIEGNKQLSNNRKTVDEPVVSSVNQDKKNASDHSCIEASSGALISFSGECFLARDSFSKLQGTERSGLDLKLDPQPIAVLNKHCYATELKTSATTSTRLDRKFVSKTLIAQGIRRKILQNTKIIEFLQGQDGGHVLCHGGESRTHYRQEEEKTFDDAFYRKTDKVQDLPDVVQTQRTWKSVPQWNLRDALLETMKDLSAFCFTIAQTSDEMLASLSQPYPLHMLLVLHDEARSQTALPTDCFDIMMTIARWEGRRGRAVQLFFRLANGFGCLLHSRYDVNTERQWLLVSTLNDPDEANDWLLESLRVYEIIFQQTKKNHKRQVCDSGALFLSADESIAFSGAAALRSVLDFACLFEHLLSALLSWLSVAHNMHYYGDVHPVLRPFIDCSGIVHLTSWFHCNLLGTVKSVLLSLPNAESDAVKNKSSCEVPLMARRRLACLTLCMHVPFYAVWQSDACAVKVVLSNTHVLHHIDMLDGILLDQRELAIAVALLPNMSHKFELFDYNSTLIDRGIQLLASGSAAMAVENSSKTDGGTNALAFQLLSAALRRSWTVVGLVLPAKAPFDEDAFMDTVVLWAYALPRAIVIFYTDNTDKEFSNNLSARFFEAFAPVADMESALAATCVDA